MEKKGIRAQSQIITTILLIVLVLAAIIIVWAVVNNLITESAEGIGTSALTTRLEIKEANLWVTGGAEVIVKREPGEGDITALKFIFYNEDGESVIIEETEKIPKEIETKIYDFVVDEYPELCNINKVSVVPMFGEKSGMEFSEKKPNIDVAVSELVSWWKFDGNAQDSVGENHGTPSGGVDLDYEDAERGKVASFDGVDDYVTSSPIQPNSITVSLWLNLYNWVDPTTSWSSHHIYLGGFGIVTSTQWTTWIRDVSGRRYLSTDIDHTLNEWHHVTLTYDKTSGNHNAYVNGELGNSQNLGSGTPIVFSGSNLRFSTPSYLTHGLIDDVMIFNKALTPEEVGAIYNNQLK